jgi:hypothetical protein
VIEDYRATKRIGLRSRRAGQALRRSDVPRGMRAGGR